MPLVHRTRAVVLKTVLELKRGDPERAGHLSKNDKVCLSAHGRTQLNYLWPQALQHRVRRVNVSEHLYRSVGDNTAQHGLYDSSQLLAKEARSRQLLSPRQGVPRTLNASLLTCSLGGCGRDITLKFQKLHPIFPNI